MQGTDHRKKLETRPPWVKSPAPLRTTKSGRKRVYLTSRGNGKRNEKSDGTMLPSGAICGNSYDHAVISCCAWELTFEA